MPVGHNLSHLHPRLFLNGHDVCVLVSDLLNILSFTLALRVIVMEALDLLYLFYSMFSHAKNKKKHNYSVNIKKVGYENLKRMSEAHLR